MALEVLKALGSACVRLPEAESTALAHDLVSLVVARTLLGAQVGVFSFRSSADVDHQRMGHDRWVSLSELGLGEGVQAVIPACAVVANHLAEGRDVPGFGARLWARATAVNTLLRSVSHAVGAMLV